MNLKTHVQIGACISSLPLLEVECFLSLFPWPSALKTAVLSGAGTKYISLGPQIFNKAGPGILELRALHFRETDH